MFFSLSPPFPTSQRQRQPGFPCALPRQAPLQPLENA